MLKYRVFFSSKALLQDTQGKDQVSPAKEAAEESETWTTNMDFYHLCCSWLWHCTFPSMSEASCIHTQDTLGQGLAMNRQGTFKQKTSPRQQGAEPHQWLKQEEGRRGKRKD